MSKDNKVSPLPASKTAGLHPSRPDFSPGTPAGEGELSLGVLAAAIDRNLIATADHINQLADEVVTLKERVRELESAIK